MTKLKWGNIKPGELYSSGLFNEIELYRFDADDASFKGYLKSTNKCPLIIESKILQSETPFFVLENFIYKCTNFIKVIVENKIWWLKIPREMRRRKRR